MDNEIRNELLSLIEESDLNLDKFIIAMRGEEIGSRIIKGASLRHKLGVIESSFGYDMIEVQGCIYTLNILKKANMY